MLLGEDFQSPNLIWWTHGGWVNVSYECLSGEGVSSMFMLFSQGMLSFIGCNVVSPLDLVTQTATSLSTL